MYLVQLLLPLYNNAGERLPGELYAHVRNELVDRFGGLTAYTRAPASGLWQENEEKTVHDDLVIYEVMTEAIDYAWWQAYRAMLEERFLQETLIIRSHVIQML
jgi:hypothetical protein